MKKFFVYLCLSAMVMGFTACGRNDDTQQNTEQSVEGTMQATPGPTQEPTEAPVEMDLQTLKGMIVDAVGAENYWPDMALDGEMLEGTFGITADMYDDFLAEMPSMSTNVDTLLIIKAKDDKVEAVREALNSYREAKVNDTLQYPMNVGKIQASRIETFGNYVCFVQLGGDTMTALDSGDEAVIEQCQQVNELVLEIIAQNVH